MPVSGFDGSESCNSVSGTGSPTIIRLGRSGARTAGWKRRQGRGVACRDLGCKYLDLDCVQELSSPGSEIWRVSGCCVDRDGAFF
jgi:hypothetical protein